MLACSYIRGHPEKKFRFGDPDNLFRRENPEKKFRGVILEGLSKKKKNTFWPTPGGQKYEKARTPLAYFLGKILPFFNTMRNS